jgi:hypothetical protein
MSAPLFCVMSQPIFVTVSKDHSIFLTRISFVQHIVLMELLSLLLDEADAFMGK